MHFTSLAAVSLASVAAAAPHLATRQTTGKLGNAQRVTDNPTGAMAEARLIPTGDSQIQGYVRARSGGSASAPINMEINISGLPSSGGPFLYHIHVDPVPEDGNCTSTLGHLDPYIRGEDPPCDASAPQTCQVGDLSGKHGKIMGRSIATSYDEPYVSLRQGEGSYFANRSVVFHKSDKTRIACANFAVVFPGFELPGWTDSWDSATAMAVGQASADATANAQASAWGKLKNKLGF